VRSRKQRRRPLRRGATRAERAAGDRHPGEVRGVDVGRSVTARTVPRGSIASSARAAVVRPVGRVAGASEAEPERRRSGGMSKRRGGRSSPASGPSGSETASSVRPRGRRRRRRGRRPRSRRPPSPMRTPAKRTHGPDRRRARSAARPPGHAAAPSGDREAYGYRARSPRRASRPRRHRAAAIRASIRSAPNHRAPAEQPVGRVRRRAEARGGEVREDDCSGSVTQLAAEILGVRRRPTCRRASGANTERAAIVGCTRASRMSAVFARIPERGVAATSAARRGHRRTGRSRDRAQRRRYRSRDNSPNTGSRDGGRGRGW